MKEYNYDELNRSYEAMCVRVCVHAVTTTRIVGGLPATEEGIRAFIKFQMKIDDADEEKTEEALQSIIRHEINRPMGTRQIVIVPAAGTPEATEAESSEGEEKPVLEVTEVQTSSVNLIRSDEHGSYLGDWMLKANIKTAASRTRLFKRVLGSKGDMTEMGRVRAIGISALDRKDRYNLNRIYLRDAGGKPMVTDMDYLRGRIQTPKGPNSIVTLSEYCPPGAHIEFEYRFFDTIKVTDEEIADLFASAMNIGVGSAKAFECGKFRIEKLTVERATKRKGGGGSAAMAA